MVLGPFCGLSLSEIAVLRRAEVRDHIADVVHAGEVYDQPFEPHAETGVGAAAEFAEVYVPVHLILGDAQFVHALGELIEAVFSLAAAHELAGAGDEEVDRADGLSVGSFTVAE